MIPVDAKTGQIFVDEGEPMSKILILDRGALVRTRLSVPEEDLVEMQISIRNMSGHNRHNSLVDNSVIVDRIEGRGHISGLLHSVQEDSVAFATVSADSDDTKVWLMSSEDFRESITSKPEFALAVLANMARELRVGSKSLRGLIKKSRKGGMEGDKKSNKKYVRVLCYDTTSWVSEGFNPVRFSLF